jgi:8-oxo-dGTP pyrophosphatase MutT (NUDIX family)
MTADAEIDPVAAAVPEQSRLGSGTPDDIAARLTDFLTRVDRDQSFPNSRPRDAATLIIIDRSATPPKVLLGRRHTRHKFMPGKFVFPGGRVELNDRKMACVSELDSRVEARLLQGVKRPSRLKARALALAAIRETFEETGLLLGKRDGRTLAAEGPWAAFAEAGVLPDLGEIHFIVRAITPPRRPRRFDTRFFAVDAEAIAHRVEGVVGPDAELVELVWLPITEAERLDMPGITTAALEELGHRIANGFSHDLPVPFYRMPRRRFTRALL